MANQQIENGFVRISNDILEALCKIKIPAGARQLFDFIIRKTYGFNQKECRLETSDFRATGIIDRRHIHRELQKLKAMGLIIITRKENEKHFYYSIQENYTLWKPITERQKKLFHKLRGDKIGKSTD